MLAGLDLEVLFASLSLCAGRAQCRERLEKELAEAGPPNSRVKVTSPANAIERRFSVWIGAALACVAATQ